MTSLLKACIIPYVIFIMERKNNILDGFINHSGGAVGSDSYWGHIGEQYGVVSNHYYYGEKTPEGNFEISEEDYEEGRIEAAKAARFNWGYQYQTMKDNRLIRNWAQVKYSDAIFAIGHLVRPGEKMFPNQKNDTRVAINPGVQGGTGYAVAMAILHGKPVYVFDQERNKWFKNIDGKWSESDVPALTYNFAGIGTRNLNENGKKAIEEVYSATINKTIEELNDEYKQQLEEDKEEWLKERMAGINLLDK